MMSDKLAKQFSVVESLLGIIVPILVVTLILSPLIFGMNNWNEFFPRF
ncbi:MAG: hypothetical protein AAF984_04450 [Verrucomicrobiota bacterium]